MYSGRVFRPSTYPKYQDGRLTLLTNQTVRYNDTTPHGFWRVENANIGDLPARLKVNFTHNPERREPFQHTYNRVFATRTYVANETNSEWLSVFVLDTMQQIS